MSFWEHLDALRKCVLRIALGVGVITAFVFLFDIRTYELYGYTILYPYPDIMHTISTQIFLRITHDLLPATVKVVALTPWDALFVQFQVALMLGISLGMPIIIYEIGKFIGPALRSHEKKLIVRLVVPATILFIIGNLFAYFFIIPFSIEFLYHFALAMGVEQFFTIGEFISFVMLFSLAFGIIFELPVIMVALSHLGIVSPEFWLRNWRWAFLITLIFAALITPDSTGITMMMVALPMIVLYFIGYIVAKSENKMQAVGIIIACIGSGTALLSCLHDYLRLPFSGENYGYFGWFNWLVVLVGMIAYTAGFVMVVISSKKYLEPKRFGNP